jgi:pyruvate/oxaloacetate carboxyltransferase
MFTIKSLPIQPDAQFTDINGIQRPAGWIRHATPEQRAAAGIVEVADPEHYDDRFYWGPNHPKDLLQLQVQFTSQIKDTTNKLLQQSDWMIIRQVERDIEVPIETKVYRDAVIKEAAKLEALILGADTVEQLITAVSNQNWPTK